MIDQRQETAMSLRLIFGAIAAAVLGLSTPADAWGEAGHRVICHMAWEKLHEQPRANLKDLLAIETREEFAETCIWADAHARENPATVPWYEIHVPPDARSIDLGRDCPEDRSCIVREIERNVAILKSGASRAERAIAAKFVANMVGDIHQPLRVGLAEDRGGADIRAIFLGKTTTMREIWDTYLIESDPPALAEVASIYHPYTPLDRLFVDWTNALPLEWANESLWIMRTPATGYLGNPGGLEFDQVYIHQNRAVAFDRLAKAGMRLGHLLNEILR